jgi:CheY-like chemotaxis protein
MSRLLILDDTPEQQEQLVNAGRDAGFSANDIVVAGNTVEAATLIGQPIDVAIVDLHLGGEFDDASLAFIKRLRTIFPKCWIIGFTTQLDNTVGALSIAYGANDFISGKWRTVPYFGLLVEKLSIFRALAEGLGFPLSSPM